MSKQWRIFWWNFWEALAIVLVAISIIRQDNHQETTYWLVLTCYCSIRRLEAEGAR